MNELNDLSYTVIGCVYKVHAKLGPGLLESSYETCLEHEMLKAKLKVNRQMSLPIIYDDIKLKSGYKLDFLINVIY